MFQGDPGSSGSAAPTVSTRLNFWLSTIRNINLCWVELPKFWSFPSSGLLWFWTGVSNGPGSVRPGDTGLRLGSFGSAGRSTDPVPPRGRFLADPAAADGSVPSGPGLGPSPRPPSPPPLMLSGESGGVLMLRGKFCLVPGFPDWSASSLPAATLRNKVEPPGTVRDGSWN